MSESEYKHDEDCKRLILTCSCGATRRLMHAGYEAWLRRKLAETRVTEQRTGDETL